MNCEIYGEYMMKHFDDDINDIESAQLKNHLKMCGKCRKEYEELEEVLCDVQKAYTLEPPMDFEKKVMDRINLVHTSGTKRKEWVLSFFGGFAAAALIVISMGVIINFGSINIFTEIGKLAGYLSSFIIAAAASGSILNTAYACLINAVLLSAKMCAVIIKDYYYVFGVLLIILLLLQKAALNVVRVNKHNRYLKV